MLQASLLGSILSNLLLMTRLGFLLGGISWPSQYFNAPVAQTIGMLLLLAVLSIIIPTASRTLLQAQTERNLAQSRGTACIILVSYFLWLFFQLKTHRSMFDIPPEHAPSGSTSTGEEAEKGIRGMLVGTPPGMLPKTPIKANGDAKKDLDKSQLFDPATIDYSSRESIKFADRGAQMGTTGMLAGVPPGMLIGARPSDKKNDEELQLSYLAATLTLIISTILIALNTQFATDSIQGLLHAAGLSDTFLGLIILPLLSVDPISLKMAVRNKMHLSIALTLEKCMQTALMVVPLVVILAWCMGINEMGLDFDAFAVIATFASVIIVTYVVQEGRSNW